MARITKRSQLIRDFILAHVTDFPQGIARLTAEEFGISRQSVGRHLERLVVEGMLVGTGRTRGRTYAPRALVKEIFGIHDVPGLEEDQIWREQILPYIDDIPQNVLNLCHYGFTEMLNNVRDHSGSATAVVVVERTSTEVELRVSDRGVGIFKKIQQDLGLHDAQHALLELSKGKLTTDRSEHTGEGIFFTSKMFDRFSILSGEHYYGVSNGGDGWLLERPDDDPLASKAYFEGTSVLMNIALDSQRTTQAVFDDFAVDGDFQFARTRVPIRLARYGQEQLVSRSQAKRVLARFDEFREVFLDFQGVETVGPAFADEIFRVFKNAHPDIKMVWVHVSQQVEGMIQRALNAAA